MNIFYSDFVETLTIEIKTIVIATIVVMDIGNWSIEITPIEIKDSRNIGGRNSEM